MERQPYFYPPIFISECRKKKRRNLFEKEYPDHECLNDPYYPERNFLFKEIEKDYSKKLSHNFQDEKNNWRDSMQKVYNEYDIKTPYNYYEEFIHNIRTILQKTENPDAIPYLLVKYLQKTYKNDFNPDPFYAFFSILDFLIFELFNGFHTTHNSEKLRVEISDKNLLVFIHLLINNSLLGITQFRFVLYFTILYKNDSFFKSVFNLFENIDLPLYNTIGKNSISIKIYKRLLLNDALEFAYIQMKFLMVDFLINECNVPFKNISPKIITAIQRKSLSESIKNRFSARDLEIIYKYYVM